MEEHQCIERLARDDGEIARARRIAANTLRSWGSDVDLPDTELIVSELVTNALLHGRGGIWMRLSCDRRRIRVEVIDEGGTDESPRLVDNADNADIGGRGLHLVDALADRWGADDEQATRVWAETLRHRSS